MTHVVAHDQAVTVLHQAVRQIAQLGFLARALAHQARIRVGGGGERVVRTPLTVEIMAITAAAVLRPKAYVRGPRFQQGAIHRKMLVADQIVNPRQQHGMREEGLRHRLVERPVAIERERRVIPHRIVDVQAHEPAKQQVVLNLLHQQTFAAHAVDYLQQHCMQQYAQLADWMIARHATFHRYVRKKSQQLDVRSAHRSSSSIDPGYGKFLGREILNSLVSFGASGWC